MRVRCATRECLCTVMRARCVLRVPCGARRGRLSLAELLAVLRAELVGAFGAFEGVVGLLPEALGIEEDAQLPEHPYRECEEHEDGGVEAADEHNGSEHHKVIPIIDTAGGAAASVDYQTEGTPDEHADEVADVEKHRHHKEEGVIYDVGVVEDAEDGEKCDPDQKR